MIRGSALISALFIMTLVAIAATATSMRIQLDIYRTHLGLQSDKLYLTAQSVQFWAMSTLKTQSKHPKPIRIFPKQLFEESNLHITGRLYDLQSKFNLNNLKDKQYYWLFLNLLKNTLPHLKPFERESLALATSHWVSPYKLGRGQDSLSSYYLKQNPPYYPSQQPLQEISEFRLIEGVSAKNYQALSAYITALPEITPINLNTAPKAVLKAFGLTETDLQTLLQERDKPGGLNPFTLSTLLKKLKSHEAEITLESQYFMSIAKVSSDDLNLVVYSVLKRYQDKNQQIAVQLISESNTGSGSY